MYKKYLFVLSVYSAVFCAGLWDFRINDNVIFKDSSDYFIFNSKSMDKNFNIRGLNNDSLIFIDAARKKVGINCKYSLQVPLTIQRDTLSTESTVLWLRNTTPTAPGTVAVGFLTNEGDSNGTVTRADIVAYRNGTDNSGTIAIRTRANGSVLNRMTINDTSVRILDTTTATSTSGALRVDGGGLFLKSVKVGTDSTAGVILESQNGNQWRLKVGNAGEVSAVAYP